MSTWSLEHIPAAGGASTFGSLKVWGIESFAWQRVNWGIDTLTVSVCGSAPAFSSAIWSYLDKIVLWRDGVRFAQAWCTFAQSNVQPHQTRTYTLQGPGWFLTQYAPSYDAATTIYTAGAYMALALGNAVAAGAPIAYASSVAAAINVECPEVRTSSTILELLQRACRYAPLSAGWWDYSVETPTFHAARRGDLTALDLERSSYVSEPFSLAPRYDLQLKSVRLQFGWSGSTSYYYDTAGTDVELQGPNRLRVALSFSTPEAALKAAGAGIAAKLMADLGPLCWTGTIPLHDGASRIPDIRPGIAVNLTGAGCRPEWATMAAVVQQVTYNHQLGTDTASIELGPPEHLGPQDYLETATLAREAGSSAGGVPSPYDQPTPPTDQLPGGDPGTYDDLNGTTGGGTPEGIVAVQARGGSWGLVGLAEYGTPSTPPRRFCSLTWAGSHTISDASVPCSSTATWSGVGAINPSTLATTSTHTRHLSQGGCTSGDEDVDYAWDASPSDSMVMASTCSATSTVQTCTPDEWFAPTVVSGVVTATLGDEDTDDSAISRLLGTSPEWGSATTAIRTLRATGITGLYREARYRTEHTAGDPAVTSPTLIGLSPWQRYRLTVTLESRPVDEAGAPTGDWAESGTRTHYLIADITGEGGVDWQTVEPTAGYETRIASTLVEVA